MTLNAFRRAQFEGLKRMLATRHAEMLGEMQEDVARARQETYGAVAGPVTDIGDRASADVLADLAQAEVSRDLRELQEVEAALARMDAGTYGRCMDCDAEIDADRLRAYPTAMRCSRCQATHERTFAHPGAHRL